MGNKNVDIFDVIQKAIKVAVTDHPQEFMRRRDEIAHYLYWCEFSQEEKTRLGQVSSIKATLENHASESAVIYESLNKLHNMGLSFKVVDAADIGNIVSRFQHHASRKVKQIAEMIIASWIRRAMFDGCCEKMPALLQQDEQNVRETRKSLKVRIKVLTGKDLTSKGALKRNRDEFEPVMRKDLLKKPTSFNVETKNTKINSEKAGTPKGRVEQRVKLINSNLTMEEKLDAARRKLREATKFSDKKRSIKLLQSWEVNKPLPPESQQKKRFRR